MDILQPRIDLFRRPDGLYHVEVLTLTADRSIRAGPVIPGPPPGLSALPGERAYCLVLDRAGHSIPHIGPVRHSIPDVHLDERHSTVVIWTVLESRVVGSSRVRRDETKDAPDPTSVHVVGLSSWHAWVEMADIPELRVYGEVQALPGSHAQLTVRPVQGRDPARLVLDLTILPPSGHVPPITTHIPVLFNIGLRVADTFRAVGIIDPVGNAELVPVEIAS